MERSVVDFKRRGDRLSKCVTCYIFSDRLIGQDVTELDHDLLSARRSMSRFTLDLTNTIVNHNIYPISPTFYFPFLHHSHENPVVAILLEDETFTFQF